MASSKTTFSFGVVVKCPFNLIIHNSLWRHERDTRGARERTPANTFSTSRVSCVVRFKKQNAKRPVVQTMKQVMGFEEEYLT